MVREAALGAMVGALVTVGVYEGRAMVGDTPVGAGETITATTRVPSVTARVATPEVRRTVDATTGEIPEAIRAHVEALEQELAESRLRLALMEGQLAVAQGVEVPWPEAVPRGWSPSEFEDAVAHAMEGEEAAELLELDCGEYPCVAVVRAPGEIDGDPAGGLSKRMIERMKEVLGSDSAMVMASRNDTNGTMVDTIGIGLIPEHEGTDDNVQERMQFRLEAAMGAHEEADVDVR